MAAGQYKVIRRGKDNSWKYINKAMIKKIKESGMDEKYDKSGIYCITIDGKIAYIGQSGNMLNRIASHMGNIEMPQSQEYNSKKYRLLRLAKEEGHQIGFDVLFYCGIWDLNRLEADAILNYMPPLNTKIPGHPDQRITSLTLPQLLEKLYYVPEGEYIRRLENKIQTSSLLEQEEHHT